ncbi:MAG: bifunctional riboflavin kinase/FAD synthetase [Actinomycetota bacterium]|nr:bifunctional riboflavin kinase/FAD synthetase [Actinomycetota bacterium]
MHVWSSLDDIPTDLGRTVVTLGNFDGVHKGHRAVLSRVVERATTLGLTSVAVTFEPHPVAVLYPERAPEMLLSLTQRTDLLAQTGLDATLVLTFTREFAQLTPEDFVQQVFVDALRAAVVVVGKDTRFGVRNTGNVDTLSELGDRLGFEVVALDDIGHGARWSSSMVRGQLAAGDVEGAADVLGRPPLLAGTVVHGDHRGRELGYPTANLSADVEGLVPADGVYAGWLTRVGEPVGSLDRTLPAAVSIGTNPTFQGTERRVEAYVLDRTDLDLYGERVTYELVRRLRPTLRFEGIEPLVAQMETDVAQCREILSSIVPT